VFSVISVVQSFASANGRGENRFPPTTQAITLLFCPCYFRKSNGKTLAHQRLGKSEAPLLFFRC
jgi:hypothetical protein